MGQRLVVTIKHDSKDIAKIYYHWSAYTMSALYKTKELVNFIYNRIDETKDDMLLRLIHFCYANGGGIRGDDYEFKYITNLYPGASFKDSGYSRNNGLIALSERGMSELQGWSEGDVTIDIDEDVIEFGVCGWYESLLEYNEQRSEWDEEWTNGIAIQDVPDIGYDLGHIAVEELNDVIAVMDEVDCFIVRNGHEVFELIA